MRVVQKCSAAVEPEETFDKLYYWSRVTKVHSTAAGTTYATRVSPLRQLDMTTRYHNGYAVAPTVYAAAYTVSTGASPMGKEKTPSVRESTGR